MPCENYAERETDKTLRDRAGRVVAAYKKRRASYRSGKKARSKCCATGFARRKSARRRTLLSIKRAENSGTGANLKCFGATFCFVCF
jgi:hypothetical protein